MWVFSRRVLVGANIVSLLIGAVLMGLTSYVPTFAQGVLGHGALASGFALAAMTIGWPIAAATAGRIYMRAGFRTTALIGVCIIVVGAGLLLLVDRDSSLVEVAAFSFIVGVGLGYTASPTLVAVQSSVGWDRRGVVTATNMFARSVGSAVGVAVFGAVANATLSSQFATPPQRVGGQLPASADDAALVLDSASGADAAVKVFVRDALALAAHHVFIVVAALAVVMVAAVLLLPRHTRELTFDD
jgi:MFS family permease